MRARRAAGLLLPVLCACGAEPDAEAEAPSAAPPAASARAPNILLVSFDTLRADHLGCYGWDRWGRSISPAVDALAARGVLFESCWAPRGQTRPSLASMLSGKYPITTGLRENRLALLEQHRSFFELLAAAGWDTGIFLANFDTGRLGGSWAYRGATTAVSGKLPGEQGPVSLLEKQWDDRVEEAALGWLAGRTADRPFAAWVHFFDIHDPYNPPEGFDLYGHAEGLPEVLRAPGPHDGEALNAWLAQVTLGSHDPTPAERDRVLGLYDGTVTATDARLRRLLETLDATGLGDSTCVIFTSDHGEELGDRHGYWYHDSSVWPGTLRIPLVVAGPGIPAGVRVPAQVQNLDIAATALELCGLPVPSDMESRSLVGLLRGTSHAATRPHAFLEFQDILYAVVGEGHQYVHNPRHAQPRKVPYFKSGRSLPIGCFEGYDLRIDPLAQHDLLAGLDPAPLIREENLPEPLRPLRRALLRWLNEPQHEREMSWPGLSIEALPDLMALGYVGGGADREDVLFLEDCQGR